MRVAYLDCFAGIAGDMMLGALLDAGVPLAVLEEAVAALNMEASLTVERVDRSGISCTKVHVLERGHLADDPEQAYFHSHAAPQDHRHEAGHTHTHEDGSKHVHGRSLTTIRDLIRETTLHDQVKALAIHTFELLGESEARIHNVSVEQIQFHEVGAVDAIVDIVASCAGIHHLAVDAWYCSPLNVGSGMVQCAHGNYPVPAPATADLLRNVPTYAAHLRKELVTPTGAALVRALRPQFGEQPAMRVTGIGYGAGTRNPEGFPNVVRLSVGELTARAVAIAPSQPATASTATSTVAVLETAVDDATPQLLAFAAEQALSRGALDVMLTPVIMKKGRPGTLITLLCEPHRADALTSLLLRETPTLGIRVRHEQRSCLDREHITVDTTYGPIRLKLGSRGGEVHNIAPEFEDCKAAALRCDVPLKQVQAAAVAAYISHSGS